MALTPYDRDNVPLTREAIAEYLDGAIRYWRNLRANSDDSYHALMACYYIDAFISVRVSLTGELGE